jgi:DNA-binding NtrC family response regulator
VLQEREFERIGGRETVKVDVRLISATNKNLEELIAQEAFRRDLYYRLNVFPVVIPPLRERKEDIPDLARHFIVKFGPEIGKRVSGVTQAAVDKLCEYDWPGNVRELENVIERALILCQSTQIDAPDLDFGPVQVLASETVSGPVAIAAGPGAGASAGAGSPAQGTAPPGAGSTAAPAAGSAADAALPLGERLGAQEREQIVVALERSGGNVTAAARALGINRSTLYYRLRKHGLDYLLPGRSNNS